MFDLEFLFAAALWALPLAGLPVLLHLLFRRKSPVVLFSTLRFVKLSVQRTAVRRRIQKWLLLACRVLLIALLIWAVAQPVRRMSDGWLGGRSARSTIAAVVVDCSYSMQLQEAHSALLTTADGIVQDLIHRELAGAKVAIFRNLPPKDRAEELRDASAVLAEWSPLQPQASPRPLVDRITAAAALLDRQPAERKWLVVISDFQAREFARPITGVKDARIVLIDVHPKTAHAAGITSVTVAPQQPIPGIASEAVLELTGTPGDSRAIVVKALTLDESSISPGAPAMVGFDTAGHATVRFSIKLPADRYVMLNGALTADDATAWDNARSQLIEIPPKRNVIVLSHAPPLPAERFVKLALDPSEGKSTDWPLLVKASAALSRTDDVTVAILSQWPGLNDATTLRDAARAGHTVILFLQPGVQESWPTLDAPTRSVLSELLPSAPIARSIAGAHHVAVADLRSALVEGLIDERFQLAAISVRGLVPMTADAGTAGILNAVPSDPTSGARTQGLLYRKSLGDGTCFTIATAPDSRFTNFATHPLFLPILVRMALASVNQSSTANIELGQPLVLRSPAAAGESELQIETPLHEQYRVKATDDPGGRRFIFEQANAPGIYRWQKVGQTTALAMTNVQLPAVESELTYRPAAALAGPETIVTTGMSDLRTKLTALSAPEPRWSIPITIVLVLICLEALIGNFSRARNENASAGTARQPTPPGLPLQR